MHADFAGYVSHPFGNFCVHDTLPVLIRPHLGLALRVARAVRVAPWFRRYGRKSRGTDAVHHLERLKSFYFFDPLRVCYYQFVVILKRGLLQRLSGIYSPPDSRDGKTPPAGGGYPDGGDKRAHALKRAVHAAPTESGENVRGSREAGQRAKAQALRSYHTAAGGKKGLPQALLGGKKSAAAHAPEGASGWL